VRKSRLSEEQIIGILKEAEAGWAVKDLCRDHGVSQETVYRWRRKYGGMEASDARRLKQLADENRRLKNARRDRAVGVREGRARADRARLAAALTLKPSGPANPGEAGLVSGTNGTRASLGRESEANPHRQTWQQRRTRSAARRRPGTRRLRFRFGCAPLPRPRESAGVSGRVAGCGRKVSATADWVAVGGVYCEPVSVNRFLDPQGKYREFGWIRGYRGHVADRKTPRLRPPSAGFPWAPEQGTTAQRSGSFPPGAGKPMRLLPGTVVISRDLDPTPRARLVQALAPRKGGWRWRTGRSRCGRFWRSCGGFTAGRASGPSSG